MNEILPGQLIQDAFNKGCLPIPKPETGPVWPIPALVQTKVFLIGGFVNVHRRTGLLYIKVRSQIRDLLKLPFPNLRMKVVQTLELLLKLD